MTFQGNQKWNEHISGKGGVISALNQRLFTIKRLNNSINKKSLIKVADSIFNSKIRYGLQLMGKARISTEDSVETDFNTIQKV